MASDNTDMVNQREIWDESELPLLRSLSMRCLSKNKDLDDIVAEMIKATTEKVIDIIIILFHNYVSITKFAPRY